MVDIIYISALKGNLSFHIELISRGVTFLRERYSRDLYLEAFETTDIK